MADRTAGETAGAAKRVLVICTGNRARSQMAHGWLGRLGGGRLDVFSAGTEPKGVHPAAIAVMSEAGIDIAAHTSDHVDQYAGEHFDLVLTVCDAAREACPALPGAKRMVHRSIPDPDDLGLDEAAQLALFREIRDRIEHECREIAAELLE